MKLSHSLALAALGSAAIAAAPQTTQSPQSDDLAAKVGVLERRIGTLEGEIAELRKAPAGAEAVERALDELRTSLRTQGDAATKLETALDDAQSKGFTFGINPDSRVVLLQGFHDYCQSVRSAAPASAKTATAAAGSRAAQR